jgi:hypothetical protein
MPKSTHYRKGVKRRSLRSNFIRIKETTPWGKSFWLYFSRKEFMAVNVKPSLKKILKYVR